MTDCAFLTSEMNSAQNFSLENIFKTIFFETLYFAIFGSQTCFKSETVSYIVQWTNGETNDFQDLYYRFLTLFTTPAGRFVSSPSLDYIRKLYLQ